MARIQGLQGGLSGKLGNTVFRQRKGETIATQYQPVVSNPRTPAQVSQRERFKALNQLAAMLAGGLGFPYNGAITPRNRFVQKNSNNVVFDDNTNSVKLNALNLSISDGPLSILSATATTVTTDSFSQFDIVAKGAAFGNLAVATRPERGGTRTLFVVGLAVPKTGTDFKVLFGGVESLTPDSEEDLNASYEGAITFQAWEGYTFDEFIPVLYIYEAWIPSAEANRNYGNVNGAGLNDVPWIALNSQANESVQSSICTMSSAILVANA